MTSIKDLLASAESVGVHVSALGSKLLLEADGPPPDELLYAIRSQKPALLDWFARNASASVSRGIESFQRALSSLASERPAGVPFMRWGQAVRDGSVFLSEWGETAWLEGWTPEKLFGLHETEPLARYDHMGAIWLLQGRGVIAVCAKAITLDSGLQIYRWPRALP